MGKLEFHHGGTDNSTRVVKSGRLSLLPFPIDADAEEGKEHYCQDCQSAVSNRFGDVDSLRVEGHDNLMLACRNLDGTQDIIGPSNLRSLSVDGASPAWIVDLAEDNDSTLLALHLV